MPDDDLQHLDAEHDDDQLAADGDEIVGPLDPEPQPIVLPEGGEPAVDLDAEHGTELPDRPHGGE